MRESDLSGPQPLGQVKSPCDRLRRRARQRSAACARREAASAPGAAAKEDAAAARSDEAATAASALSTLCRPGTGSRTLARGLSCGNTSDGARSVAAAHRVGIVRVRKGAASAVRNARGSGVLLLRALYTATKSVPPSMFGVMAMACQSAPHWVPNVTTARGPGSIASTMRADCSLAGGCDRRRPTALRWRRESPRGRGASDPEACAICCGAVLLCRGGEAQSRRARQAKHVRAQSKGVAAHFAPGSSVQMSSMPFTATLLAKPCERERPGNQSLSRCGADPARSAKLPAAHAHRPPQVGVTTQQYARGALSLSLAPRTP